MSPGSGDNDALPQRVKGELAQRHVSFAAGGRRHSLAMTKDNNLFAFGIGENGQLGLGNTNNSRAPQRVPHFSGVPLALVTTGWGHSVAITTKGEVLTWGWNEEAQCGLGTTQQMILRPTEIKSLRGVKIVQAAAGADHTILVDDQGNLFGFGSAKMHQIGTGSLNNVAHPVQLKAFPTTQEAFKGVSCGFGHTVAITETGKVFSCGYNPDGQCGTLHHSNRDNSLPSTYSLD
jgi:alpha-tubulin suppressor-like RCC1 family protein